MPSADWKRILCPIDFSDASRAALETAADLATRYGARVALFHAYPVPGYTFPDGSFVASSKMLDELSAQANRHMEEWKALAEGMGVGQVEVATAVGEPAHEILAFAKEQQRRPGGDRDPRPDRAAARADGLGGGAGGPQGHLPGADGPATGVRTVGPAGDDGGNPDGGPRSSRLHPSR